MGLDFMLYVHIVDTINWVLFIGVNVSLCSLSPVNYENLTTAII